MQTYSRQTSTALSSNTATSLLKSSPFVVRSASEKEPAKTSKRPTSPKLTKTQTIQANQKAMPPQKETELELLVPLADVMNSLSAHDAWRKTNPVLAKGSESRKFESPDK